MPTGHFRLATITANESAYFVSPAYKKFFERSIIEDIVSFKKVL